MIVRVRWPNVIVEPIARGSDPNCRRQYGVGDDDRHRSRQAVSSSGVNNRPIRAVAPNTLRVSRRHARDRGVVRDVVDRHAGLAAAGVVGERVETAVLRAPVEEVRTRNRGVARPGLGVGVGHHHDAVGRVERHRPQDHGVDDAEDRGGRANTEGERQDRRGGEAGLAHQGPNAVTHVLQQVVHAVVGRLRGPARFTVVEQRMLLSVLLALTVIIITARLMGLLFSKLDQPAVIGEVVGGILLGPSLLGHFAPGVQALAAAGGRRADSRRHLAARRDPLHVSRRPRARSRPAAQHRLDHRRDLRREHHRAVRARRRLVGWRSSSSLSPPGVPFSSFMLFVGVAMSITAFPVLARILQDRGLQQTRLGTLALTCAAINDAIAWCLLAFVVSVMQIDARRRGPHGRVDRSLYIAVMLTVGRALVTADRDAPRHRAASRRAIAGAGAGRGAAVGGRHRVHRHPRDLRRVPARRDPAARQQGRRTRDRHASPTSCG